MAKIKLDLIGQRFGRLTVIAQHGNIKDKTAWLCRCDCGNEKVVKTIDLRRGATKSCGCLQDESRRNRPQSYPHDVRIKRLRYIWHGMLRRCNSKNHKGYSAYGGRGIKVCDEWHDYVAFARWAIANGYADGLTIDRINNDGNYEPSNCRWVTEKKQHNNTSRCRFFTINNETKSMTEWAEEYGLDSGTVQTRISKGMDIIDALTKRTHRNGGRGIPVRCVDTGEEFPSASAAAEKYGYNISCIARAARLNRLSYGMRWEYVYE